MDPLSIAASAAGLATGCTKIAATLYTWIDDTISIDENVAGLSEEIKALGRVLDSISSASASAPRPVLAEIDPDGSLWAVVRATLGDINNTLGKLSQLLGEVEKSSRVFSRGFLRKPTKQIRFGLRSKEFVTYKDRVQSYITAMTSALQMINVCLMIHNNSSQDAVFSMLYGLRSQIGRVEVALHQGTEPRYGPAGSSQEDDDKQITTNFRQLVRVAETFHSNASAITREGPRSTVWGGSVLGEPLTREQLFNIDNWIPPPSSTQQDETTSPTTIVNPSYHSDSDDDIDEALIKRLRELAVESRHKGDHLKAENFYRKVINRSEASESNYDPQDLVEDKINLAYACLHQRKWADAEAIILPIAMERKLADITIYIGLHALALAHMDGSNFAMAERCCKRALWGKRKILGKENPSCWESLALLSRLCKARGDPEEAEAHQTFIPASYQPVLHLDPLVYLNGYNKKLPPPPTILQTPSPSTTQASQTRHLVVGVHFGTVQTAVSFALATNPIVEEGVIDKWPNRSGTKIDSTVPSVLYYDPEPTRTIAGWGYDIEDALSPSGYPKPGIEKSQWFILGLMNPHRTYIDAMKIPSPPTGKSPMDVVVDYLSKLHDAIWSILRSSFDMEEMQIRWWFAIPPVWDGLGGAPLRASTLRAGFIRDENDDKIFFVTEPVATLLYCCKTLLINPQPSDTFLVVVASAGAVDLAAYEVIKGNPLDLKQLTTPSGDFCGSTAVMRNFSNLLQTRIKKLDLSKGSKIAGRIYAKGIIDFNTRIKHSFSDDGSTWAVNVGLSVDYPDVGIDRESGCMAVTNKLMRACFNPPVDRVIELITDQLSSVRKQHPGTSVKTILLTGEFAPSVYLVNQIKRHVGAAFDISVVGSSDALTDVARGAVTAGVLQEHGLLSAEYRTHDYLRPGEGEPSCQPTAEESQWQDHSCESKKER
ncbi:hypothetical protein F5144DRAFT_622756 [Chaetomium tenue]|uniref:Uncharacterized protein n=1 Tax=Chaetomium tenue TaxID=1854479 RepID=A0ACB7P0P0_9PEZI|nr:hypothetical protein F5144DRAFT_622756 [Chaetomium globosum]